MPKIARLESVHTIIDEESGILEAIIRRDEKTGKHLVHRTKEDTCEGIAELIAGSIEIKNKSVLGIGNQEVIIEDGQK